MDMMLRKQQSGMQASAFIDRVAGMIGRKQNCSIEGSSRGTTYQLQHSSYEFPCEVLKK